MKDKSKIIRYVDTPDIYTIISAFRNLLRRSNVLDYDTFDSLKNLEVIDPVIPNNHEIYFPKDVDTLDENQIKIIQDREPTRMFKKKIHHEYDYMGEKKRIEYKFNQIGYRGKNVIGTEQFIAIGCSQTFGYSLEEEFTWPEQLGKLLGSRVVNLGMPGDSAQGAIMKALEYINQFGKPRAIFALFPYRRSEYFSVKGYIASENNLELNGAFNNTSYDWKNKFKKISKAPHTYQEIIPPEQNIFATFTMINIFEKYCKEAGIKFIWTGWEEGFSSNRVQDVIKNFSPGFFFENNLNEFTSIEKKCHLEYQNHPLFNYAADREFEKNGKVLYVSGHKGIHWNLHMAERCHMEYLANIGP